MEWLHRLWPASSKKPHSVPLPTPVSLHREDLSMLSCDDMLVGWKQNGVRIALIFGWEEIGVFIAKMTRKKHVLKTQYVAGKDIPEDEPDLFDGTLLDVEEMPDGRYVLLDVITCAGKGVFVQPFEQRLQAFLTIYPRYKAMLDKYNFFLREKKWFCSVKAALRQREQVEDGLIFMNKSLPYGYGSNPHLKKWKTEHTIDLECKNGTFGYLDQNGWMNVNTLGVEIDGSKDVVDGIYECAPVEGKKNKWKVKNSRPDKRYANFQTTVEDTLKSREENITLDELILLK